MTFGKQAAYNEYAKSQSPFLHKVLVSYYAFLLTMLVYQVPSLLFCIQCYSAHTFVKTDKENKLLTGKFIVVRLVVHSHMQPLLHVCSLLSSTNTTVEFGLCFICDTL